MLYCKKQTGGEPLIDIQKDIRELSAMGLMEKLLADKTTGRHILWLRMPMRRRAKRMDAGGKSSLRRFRL